MWRSFFYAVGISLFSLGLQALVIDHVLVPKDTRLQKTIRRILTEDNAVARGEVAASPQNSFAQVPNQNPRWMNQPQQSQPSRTGLFQGVNTGSRFGPSRFAGPAYGTGYGGERVEATPQNQPAFGNFQNQNPRNTELAGYRTNTTQPVATASKPVSLQKLLVREWMPWSLLAIGAIIFLYTHTIHKRRIHE